MVHTGVGIMDAEEIFSALRSWRIFLHHFHLNYLKVKILKCLLGCPGWSLISYWYKSEKALLVLPGINPEKTKGRAKSDPFYSYLVKSEQTRGILFFHWLQGQSGFLQSLKERCLSLCFIYYSFAQSLTWQPSGSDFCQVLPSSSDTRLCDDLTSHSMILSSALVLQLASNINCEMYLLLTSHEF